MHKDNLFKGFEVELFTGTYNTHVGMSHEIEQTFSDFVKEPDNRNVEYITEPNQNYKDLYQSLLNPRKKLRKWLIGKNLTIIPSSTLCFPHDGTFKRSDLLNTYHQFIELNYGISIATSSVHINLGINDFKRLFAAIRLARCEASLYLSLSASSPFLNGEFTGNHSQRWIQFPKTPKEVPFFKDHEHYIKWTEDNIQNRKMQNIRHFWSSIRPNGPKRPYSLDRLELRICDFVADINSLLAITAFLELRTIFLFENLNTQDPLLSSKFQLEELRQICDQNEFRVAKDSLNAELIHWKNGQIITCKEWVKDLLEEVYALSKRLKMVDVIKPIYKILEEGNQSIKWINQYKKGFSIEEIMQNSINDMRIFEESNL